MSAEAVRDAASKHGRRAPVGTVNIVDPHPLNWLYITWNTMEEPVRTDEKGNIVGAAMEDFFWEGATLVVKVREGVRFQDGTTLTAHSVRRAFDEVQKWKAPHPPGTYLNFHPDTTVDVTDDYTIRFTFPEPDGLALAKFRGFHIPSERFWALSVFLCCPMVLVAVNRYVRFTGHVATLELAETEVTEEHWSRRQASGIRVQHVTCRRRRNLW